MGEPRGFGAQARGPAPPARDPFTFFQKGFRTLPSSFKVVPKAFKILPKNSIPFPELGLINSLCANAAEKSWRCGGRREARIHEPEEPFELHAWRPNRFGKLCVRCLFPWIEVLLGGAPIRMQKPDRDRRAHDQGHRPRSSRSRMVLSVCVTPSRGHRRNSVGDFHATSAPIEHIERLDEQLLSLLFER
jgi:hypothetical protein